MDIQLTAVNCFYGEQQVLHDITLKVPSGATVALLGPSGAGKSTLLRVFNLLITPRSGLLSLADLAIDCAKPYSEKIVHTLRARVGMVFQHYHLWPHMTVMANLIEAPRRVLKLSKSQACQQAEALLTRLHLLPYAHRYPLQLSGGQQQRVAIARALMMQPQLLLFDEPTASLDPEITAQVLSIMRELATTRITQVVVTHDTQVARKIANQVVYMEHGSIIEQGDVQCFTQPKTAAFARYLSH